MSDAIAAGDRCLEGVHVGTQEPREGLEVDKVDAVRVARVVEDDPHATTFLAVADNGPFGAEDGLVQGDLHRGVLLLDEEIEGLGRVETEAAREARLVFSLRRARGYVHATVMWHAQTYRLVVVGIFGQRAHPADGTAEDFVQTPSFLGRALQRVARVFRVIGLGCVTHELFSGNRSRDRVVYKQSEKDSIHGYGQVPTSRSFRPVNVQHNVNSLIDLHNTLVGASADRTHVD